MLLGSFTKLGGEMRSVCGVCAAFAFLLLGFAQPVKADCPSSCVGGLCSSRAAVDTTISNDFCYFQTGYDIPSGTLYTEIAGGISDCWAWGYAKVQDDFVVDGIPSGAGCPASTRTSRKGRRAHPGTHPVATRPARIVTTL